MSSYRQVNIAKIVIFLLVTTTFIVAARYFQAHTNREMRKSAQEYDRATKCVWALSQNPLGVEIIHTKLFREGKLDLLFVEPSDTIGEHAFSALLHFFGVMGFNKQESNLLEYLQKESRAPWAMEVVRRHLKWNFTSNILSSIKAGEYESARYYAQRFLNITSDMNDWPFFRRESDTIKNARHVVVVLKGRYVYRNEFVARIALRNWTGEEIKKGKMMVNTIKLEPSMRDLSDYLDSALASSSQSREDEVLTWVKFLNAHPDSEFIPEAKFNMISAMLEAYALIPKNDPNRLEKIVANNRRVLTECTRFLEFHPHSYLADDVLHYMLRSGFSIGDRLVVKTAYERLARQYNNSDSFKRVQGGIARWVSMADTKDHALVVAKFIQNLAKQQNTEPVENVISTLGPDADAAISGVSLLLKRGVNETRKSASGDVLGEFLFSWLSENQRIERVRALWIEPEK